MPKLLKPLVYIRRCLHFAPPALRQLAYEAFVRPKIDYAAAIRSSHQIYLANILEFIPNRAACFALSNYDRTTSM